MEQVWDKGGGFADIPASRVRSCVEEARVHAPAKRVACALTSRCVPQRKDLPLPSAPSPTFTLHNSGMQMLCYGGKPSVRAPHTALCTCAFSRRRIALALAEARHARL
jgi:hypothetical protein